MIEKILQIHTFLASRKVLAPSPLVNEAFSDLVSIVLTTPPGRAERIMSDPRIAAIQESLLRLCDKGETLLENYWAERVIRAKNPAKELEKFPYMDNYRKIYAMETGELQSYLPEKAGRVLFVGSGPLPLSAILLAKTGRWTVDVLEYDRRSAAISRTLLACLGLASEICVIHHDALYFRNYGEYDAVIVAALAGATEQQKRTVLKIVAERSVPGALVLIRSAEGLGKLLYREVSSDMLAGFQILGRKHIRQDVINPIVIARTDPGSSAVFREAAVRRLLSMYDDYQRTEHRLAQISDAMTFDDPIVWMMYKRRAYAGTDGALVSVGDLIDHCADPGDICSKRFRFLWRYLTEKYSVDIADPKQVPDTQDIQTLCASPMMRQAVSDDSFMNEWRKREYYKVRGRVAKWENAYMRT